jgi:hypothetical protein
MAPLDKPDLHVVPDLVVLPESRILTEESEILAARRLQAEEYVRVGYVPASAVTDEGTLNPVVDPWVPYSDHFGAFDGDGVLRATARVISNRVAARLPTLLLPTVDPVLRDRLEAFPPGALGEIAALARDRAAGREFPRALFRAMWLFALESGLAVYVLSVDVLVLRTLRAMDPGLFRLAGRESPAPVRPVYPVWLEVADITPEIFLNGLVSEVVLPDRGLEVSGGTVAAVGE